MRRDALRLPSPSRFCSPPAPAADRRPERPTPASTFRSATPSPPATAPATPRRRFAALLARDEGGLSLTNVAVAGATTRDVIDEQLPRAIADKPKLAFVTISAGGNDLAALIPNTSCVQDPLPGVVPARSRARGRQSNLDEIMKTLRAAYPDTPIVLLLYPNFFSGTGTRSRRRPGACSRGSTR